MELWVVPDDRIVNDTRNSESEPQPDLADWWVWGVRKIAAPVADLMLSARVLPLLFVLLKIGMWVFTRDVDELWGVGAGAAGFFALWAGGLLPGRFSAERDAPDPERWLTHQRRARER